MPTSAPKEDGDAALLQKFSRSWSEGAVSMPLPGLNVLINKVGITTLTATSLGCSVGPTGELRGSPEWAGGQAALKAKDLCPPRDTFTLTCSKSAQGDRPESAEEGPGGQGADEGD